ncbi:MAG: transglutaminase-like domain-containing protein [Actinomycetota bacterium]|nr:transglutaminase-like domain-containing protein [Actinomycetota bacterium]
MSLAPFSALAARRHSRLDELALALAAELEEVDAQGALAELDRLGAEVRSVATGTPAEQAESLAQVLGRRHGFVGDREDYDHPDNSMLDLVLDRRKGLPILLSAVYVEVARRAGIELSGVGLPGHYVVGHFGQAPPILLDPFAGGAAVEARTTADLRPWSPHETALRMLNNLLGSYQRRADLTRAIRVAEMRLELPVGEAEHAAFGAELGALRARLN